ncbi:MULTISPECIES: invasion associated locus B family protein [unclassified Bartonella]|uniref:invasion associated locus B family protein n=1 Tax=unclassified Bartonella TaxID=2645622 RepID=UPI00099993C8|nr:MULTISPECIES: invasion associated locus B family protein [unclassified Bartonella]AQX22525.1 Invasion protein IalB, involved in pathogenesis [Bartonella sp. 11B]AQX24194.1 Invasion protein IalB, involved in pathogenesis [Bartonella sp. 114]AQX24974.1 Invasion protein IalB, involved in pathogenesis [Bartonella sp. Coyote22sub2]
MIKRSSIFVSIFFTFALLGKGESFAHEKNNTYTVQPPQLSVPSGKPGEIRRLIMQFYNWTLICDENTILNQGVCNVTQTIHDEEDNTVFSWSLVSTKNGQPAILFRTLPNADTTVPIKIFMEGIKEPSLVRYTQCDETVCLAQSGLSPILSDQIEKKKSVRISYNLKEGKTLSFILPFNGLSEALFSLQR